MGQTFEDLLAEMDAIAAAVNAFESEEAQRRALDALLDAFFGHEREVRDTPSVPLQDKPDSTAPNQASTDRAEWEQEVYEGLPDEHLVAKGKRDHQAVWAVSVLRQLGQEANTTSVASVIAKRLGVSPEDKDNLSARLGKLTPQFLRRDDRDEGRGYQYFPTRQSLKVFEGLKSD